MPRGLQRFQQSRQSHFLTFSCYRRQPNFSCPNTYDLFVQCLEEMRRRFSMRIYGYVVMPEHVHLLVNEPEPVSLAEAIHYLKLSFAKRLRSRTGATTPRSFWQKRYYDRNIRDAQEFTVKLRYLHRNPANRGLVKDPLECRWSSKMTEIHQTSNTQIRALLDPTQQKKWDEMQAKHEQRGHKGGPGSGDQQGPPPQQ